MKVIAYSLFGFNRERYDNCFDFASYLRGLMINIRLQRLLFPDWKIQLFVDNTTHQGFKQMFDILSAHKNIIDVIVCDDAPLTKAMLWRLKPAFNPNVERFICRDIEAPLMYKDAQAIKQWSDSPKTAHVITASESHNIPMMGGMCGFTKHFNDFVKSANWEDLVSKGSGYDKKGADQDFLNNFVYPKFSGTQDGSIMMHFLKGFQPNHSNYFTCNCPQIGSHLIGCTLNIKLDLPDEYREADNCCGHIGAAGWYEPVTFRFLRNYKGMNTDLQEAESLHPDIFNWDI